MLKSLLKGFLTQFKRLIARFWIVPLDNLLWEMVGLEQSSPWCVVRAAIVWITELGRLIYTEFRVNISRWDGPDWSIIYVSDASAESEKELQYLFFSGSPTATELGRAFLWQLPTLVQQFVSQGCLVICDQNRLVKWRFQETYCIRIFPRLRALLDVSVPMDKVIKRMTNHRRRNLSKSKKRGFEYGVSHNPADFELFYYKMHIPYVKERFHDRARILPYESMRELFEERGELLYVEYQDKLAAAGLGTLRRYGRTFSPLQQGIDQDHTHLVKQDIIVALYWHVISWSHANHLHLVDFGGTPARLNDGIFQFKRRWGMRFERNITTHTMWTLIGKNLPLSLMRRLNELAFIAEVGQEYRCVVFDIDGASLPDKELSQREKIVAQAGLDGLLVLRPYGKENSVENIEIPI